MRIFGNLVEGNLLSSKNEDALLASVAIPRGPQLTELFELFMARLLLRRFLLRRQVERESNRLPFVAYSFSFCNRLHPQSRDGLNEPPERGEKRKCSLC